MGFVGKNTGAYALESAEAEQNAKAICDVLMPKGWTVGSPPTRKREWDGA